jgi:hypothetical protein
MFFDGDDKAVFTEKHMEQRIGKARKAAWIS